MTAPLTPEHLAELRRTADSPDQPQWGHDDVRELLDEIDRLGAERDRLWMLLEIERGLTGSIRLHADAIKRATTFGSHSHPGDVSWGLADDLATRLLAVLGPQRPHAAPQAHAPGPWAGFADGEAAETPSEAQRPAEGVERYRCPTDCDPDCEALCHEGHQVNAKQLHDVQECGKRTARSLLLLPIAPEIDGRAPMSGLEAPPGVAPTDGRLYADGPPCRHGATWLVATDTGPQCMVCGPARPDPIAPQDEGISTADVHAQAAADAPPDLRTPDQWCAEYDIRILDPDGWRGTHRLAWDFPISLAEFWRRSRTSTTDAANPAWTRVAADATRADNESEQQ